MALTPPACNQPECVVTLHAQACIGRRGDRTIRYKGLGWRCSRCADPDTGEPPLEFVDERLMKANELALAVAWRVKYGEELPASGRGGRKGEVLRMEGVTVMLTPEELERVDRRRGERSRSEFLREVISRGLRARRA